MKSFTLLSVVGILALAGNAQAAEDGTWGQVKYNQMEASESTDVTAVLPADKRPIRLAATVESVDIQAAVEPATDLSATETRSASQTVWPRGKSQVYLSDLNSDRTLDDDLYVSFAVPSGAVPEPVEVTMTVIGNRLSDLVIAFQPGGLVFDRPATLWVKLGVDLVDVDTTSLTVWHEYADGTVEETRLLTTHEFKNGYYEFSAEVPGFSRYGLRSSK